ncbi:TonB-dependent receptor [Compostibacter hankyongensis]|uniref:TonB-dependent receptor n=1 Tax=Compostibacter hankyongensis TaxID=1007089 RepID=A0ABP8FZP3_9BACT
MFTIHMEHVNVDKVLHKIQKESRYRFFYNERYLKHLNPISLNVHRAGLSEVLDRLLDKTLTYKIIDNDLVVISLKEHLEDQHKVEGMVVDEKGAPLVGVTLKVKGSSQGTVTDIGGKFTFVVPENAVLEVSYVGYQTQEITVGDRTKLTITLQPSASGLNEVVVVGYGTEKKVNLTGSVSTVSISELKQAPVTNFSNTLAGRAPGVIAINNSGEPGGDGSNILIRGKHTLNNNAALLVIDGVPSPNSTLERLNPNDIESMSILKDATASIYGAESANGVILITTKHGMLEQAPEFTLTFNQGVTQPTRIPKMASAVQYMNMINEAATYAGNTPQFTEDEIKAYGDPDRDPWLYPSTDWFRAGLKNLSLQTNANLSIRGGSKELTYYLSLGGLTEDGFYKQSATRYNQFNLRSNITAQVTKNIKIGLDLSGRKEARNYPTVSAAQIFRFLMRGRPTDPAYYPNGDPGPDLESGVQPVVTGTKATGFHHNNQYFATGNLTADITIPGLKGFNIRGLLSYNKKFQEIKDWAIPWTLYNFDKQAYINNDKKDPENFLTAAMKGPSDPQLSQTYYSDQKILANAVANYKKTFGDHNMSLMVGTEMQRFGENNFNAFRRHFISTEIPELFAGSQEDWTNNGSAAHGARLSYFSRAEYNYKNKYLFQFVGRYDGSYLFPSNSRWGFFPAFSAGWRLSEEPFFRNKIELFDELKLRASWGKTGNDLTDPTQLVEAQQYYGGYEFGGGYVLGIDNVVSSLYQSRIPNPSITWERANQFDVGIDATAIKDKLTFTLDFWRQVRTGILILPLETQPQTTGYTPPRQNIGQVNSTGFDGNIGWNQPVNEDFSFYIALNAGYSVSKVIKTNEVTGLPEYQTAVGDKIGTGLYYKSIGIFQNQKEVDAYPHWTGARPGDVMFEDVNKDGKIDANDRVRINKSIGTPDWMGGVNLSGTWKQLSLSIFFQGAAGAVQYVHTESGDIGNYFASFASKRWIPDPDDPTGMTPDPSGSPYSGPRTYDRGDAYWYNNNNTYFLRSTNYIRLKTLELGYNFSQALLNKLGKIHALRIYLNGYNLITWDKFKLLDPEASNSAGQYYPQTRVYNVGFNLTF